MLPDVLKHCIHELSVCFTVLNLLDYPYVNLGNMGNVRSSKTKDSESTNKSNSPRLVRRKRKIVKIPSLTLCERRASFTGSKGWTRRTISECLIDLSARNSLTRRGID